MFFKSKAENKKFFDEPVDLVYLWCSDKDEKWNEKRLKYLHEFSGEAEYSNEIAKKESLSECRYADNDELRHSLRSALEYAPWINKIYIITDNQIPEWLDTKNKKIKIIDHKDIIPAKYLPTFNSNVIETFIHHIPDLSEHFLFANDDMFFKAPVTKDFFFTPEGKPIVRFRTYSYKSYKDISLYLQIVRKMQFLQKKKFHKKLDFIPHHNIDAYTKEICSGCEKKFAEEYETCRENKFRKETDIERILTYFYAVSQKKAVYKIADNNDESLEIHFPRKLADCLLATTKARLFCLNTTTYCTIKDFKQMITIEKALFPEAAPWELAENKHGETIHIVLATDNNYAQHCAAAMSSVILHSAGVNKIVFHILDGGISADNKEKMRILPQTCESEIKFYDMGKYDFSRFPLNREWISEATYYRLILPEIIPAEITKILYLDCDTICVRDIAEIYNTDITDYYAAAVEDCTSILNLKRLDLPEGNKYFNAGVMLFNLDRLRSFDFKKACIEYFSQNADKITMQDQDILNGVMNGCIRYLPLCWNLSPRVQNMGKSNERAFSDPDVAAAYRNPAIIHFWSRPKPWIKKTPYYEEYWNSLAYTGFKEKVSALFEIKQIKHYTSYKLFNFLPLMTIKKNGGRTVYKSFGIPVWKIRKMANNITTKYYFCGIPVLKVSRK